MRKLLIIAACFISVQAFGQGLKPLTLYKSTTGIHYAAATGILDTIPSVRQTGISNGMSLIYNSTTKKYHASFIGKANVDTTSTGLRTASNSLTLAQAQTALNLKQNVLSGTGLVKSTSGTISYLTDNSTNWNTAFAQTRQWDGGSTGLTAATGRTSLGGTTIGQNLFTLTNPSAITFPRINADNTVSALSASAFLSAIGGISSGSIIQNQYSSAQSGSEAWISGRFQLGGLLTGTNSLFAHSITGSSSAASHTKNITWNTTGRPKANVTYITDTNNGAPVGNGADEASFLWQYVLNSTGAFAGLGKGTGGNLYLHLNGPAGTSNGVGIYLTEPGDLESRFIASINTSHQPEIAFGGGSGKDWFLRRTGVGTAAVTGDLAISGTVSGAGSFSTLAASGLTTLSNRLDVTYTASGDNSAKFVNTHASSFGAYFQGGGASNYIARFSAYDGTAAMSIFSGGITSTVPFNAPSVNISGTTTLSSVLNVTGAITGASTGTFKGVVDWGDGTNNNLGRLSYVSVGGDPAIVANTGKGFTIYTNNAGTTAAAFTSGGALTLANTVSATIATLRTTPTTSAGTYDILTRNASTGMVEKIPSSSLPAVSSGTYTPTLTNGTNVASTTPVVCRYNRIGNEVFVQGRFVLTITSVATNSVVGISLPIASDLSATGDLSGDGNINHVQDNAVIIEDTTNNRAECTIYPVGNIVGEVCAFSFSYTVK